MACGRCGWPRVALMACGRCGRGPHCVLVAPGSRGGSCGGRCLCGAHLRRLLRRRVAACAVNECGGRRDPVCLASGPPLFGAWVRDGGIPAVFAWVRVSACADVRNSKPLFSPRTSGSHVSQVPWPTPHMAFMKTSCEITARSSTQTQSYRTRFLERARRKESLRVVHAICENQTHRSGLALGQVSAWKDG